MLGGSQDVSHVAVATGSGELRLRSLKSFCCGAEVRLLANCLVPVASWQAASAFVYFPGNKSISCLLQKRSHRQLYRVYPYQDGRQARGRVQLYPLKGDYERYQHSF